ncbi:MAG: rdpA [Caulobacteraceae bacterium]|nr:rdpA [Caulobacteraceae bacterium]
MGLSGKQRESRGAISTGEPVGPQSRVTRLGGYLGARVEGVDLSNPLDTSTVASLRSAFLEHCVLVFPKQHLTADQLASFAALWGELHLMPAKRLDENPHVIEFGYTPGGRRPATDIWHSDRSCEERPPMATFLQAQTIPSAGGDTLFASQYEAYEALSDGMKAMLGGLRAIHTDERFNQFGGPRPPTNIPGAAHPVVRTHPETKRRALFVNATFTTQFEGMTIDESQPLLTWLYAHCSQPNFTFRHSWSEGDLVMWDNRCVQHYAVADYCTARTMRRATVIGDDPS